VVQDHDAVEADGAKRVHALPHVVIAVVHEGLDMRGQGEA
jgi:hypothetical protein